MHSSTGQFSEWDSKKSWHLGLATTMATATLISGPANEDRKIISPSGFASQVWKSFGLYQNANKTVDKTYPVCKICKVKIKYCSNTTNMQQQKIPPQDRECTAACPSSTTATETILETTIKLHKNLDKARQITHAIGLFTGTDLQPYSVENSMAFRKLLRAAKPRYKCPCRNHFATKEVPKIYSNAKEKVPVDAYPDGEYRVVPQGTVEVAQLFNERLCELVKNY